MAAACRLLLGVSLCLNPPPHPRHAGLCVFYDEFRQPSTDEIILTLRTLSDSTPWHSLDAVKQRFFTIRELKEKQGKEKVWVALMISFTSREFSSVSFDIFFVFSLLFRFLFSHRRARRVGSPGKKTRFVGGSGGIGMCILDIINLLEWLKGF